LTSLGAVLAMINGPRLLGNVTTELFNGIISKQVSTQLAAYAPKGISVDQYLSGFDKQKVIEYFTSSGQGQFAQMLNSVNLNISQNAGIDFWKMVSLLAIAGIVYLIAFVLESTASRLINYVLNNLSLRLRGEIERKLNKLPISYFDSVSKGEIMSRTTNDLDNLTSTLQQVLSQFLMAIFVIIGICVMIFSISWELSIIALVAIPISSVVVSFLIKKSQPKFIAQWQLTGQIDGFIEEGFSGHAILNSFNQKEEQIARFDKMNEDLNDANRQSRFISGLIQPLTVLFSNISYVFVAILGGFKIASGTISIGDIQAFIQYSKMITSPLGQLGAIMNLLQSALVSAQRVFEILDEKEEVDAVDVGGRDRGSDRVDAAKGGEAKNGEAKGGESSSVVLSSDGKTAELTKTAQDSEVPEISLKNVFFSYDKNKELIKDLNLDVKKGQVVAIVGPTGAGKTTIINLLMRFYDVDSGSINLGGKDIRDLSRHELRRNFGMVLQDTWVFEGTIEENLKYGLQSCELGDDETFYQRSRASYFDYIVQRLPNGYKTKISNDSSELSAGEKQLLTIARASIADPNILILDEATSSVDTRTEILVYLAMEKLQEGRTSFVIAHRLSTVKNADTILYLENGQVLEQGSHDELIERRGKYHELFLSSTSLV
jgi:ATP-binding cassette subfamily B protein